MRTFIFLIVILAALPFAAVAQTDPNWVQREMERMQAQQERWDAQIERQRADQERREAQAERLRAEQERRTNREQAEREEQFTRFEQQKLQNERDSDTVSQNRNNNTSLRIIPEDTEIRSPAKLLPMITGNDLYRECDPDLIIKDERRHLRCLIFFGNIAFGNKPVTFQRPGGGSCFPKGVELEQINDVVHDFLKENPKHRHRSPFYLSVAAIVQAFAPCEAVPSKKQ